MGRLRWMSDDELRAKLMPLRKKFSTIPIQEWDHHAFGFEQIGYDNIRAETRDGKPGWLVYRIKNK